MTITELYANPKKMLKWLSYDGNTPTVMVETAKSKQRRHPWMTPKKMEEKSVVDAETAAELLRQHRQSLFEAWQKVSPFRPLSWQSFQADCAKALGFKSGKAAEKIAAARAFVQSTPNYMQE